MTATEFEGHRVIEVQPLAAPFTDRDGNPVLSERMVELLLDNGEVVFGCRECEYVNQNRHSIRPHLNAHRDLKAAKPFAGLADLTLGQIAERLAAAATAPHDVEKWKAKFKAEKNRADALQRRIDEITRAFKALGITTAGDLTALRD